MFSFSFLYFSSITYVIALSILYVKHPNKDSQQFNVKAILGKKKFQSMLNLEWPDIHIYQFDNAITLKHQSNSLFWYLDNFLEEYKAGLPLEINIT